MKIYKRELSRIAFTDFQNVALLFSISLDSRWSVHVDKKWIRSWSFVRIRISRKINRGYRLLFWFLTSHSAASILATFPNSRAIPVGWTGWRADPSARWNRWARTGFYNWSRSSHCNGSGADCTTAAGGAAFTDALTLVVHVAGLSAYLYRKWGCTGARFFCVIIVRHLCGRCRDCYKQNDCGEDCGN